MQNLDAAFSALADPTRRALLARLALGEANVMELARPFAMTQPAISRHLKVLEQAGLITHDIKGANRPRRLEPAGITQIDQWLSRLREAMTANYTRLDGLLEALQTKTAKDAT